jgi:GT2 family glycosyltransferase
MQDPVASVVIPLAKDAEFLGQCLDRLMRQDFDRKEIVVVCDPRAVDPAALPQGSEDLKIIKEAEPCTLGHLINRGMCAARGHVKILLMPHCAPVGNQWMRSMVEPFDNDEVGVVVSQCAMPDHDLGLATRLLQSVDPQQRRNSHGSLRRQQVVSHLCDAYRASLLADIGYFEEHRLATPGEAVDVSLKIADAGHSIVLSDAAVATLSVPTAQKRLRGVLAKALDYGFSDAVLDKMYDLRWLNSSVCAAALFALLLLPVAAVSLPVAMILSAAVFACGWFIAVRVPVLGWDCQVFALNLGAYVVIMLLIRDDWCASVLGRQVHPAIIRQWSWLVAITGTYLFLLLKSGVQAGRRSLAMPKGARNVAPIVLLAMLWWLIAGAGYLRGVTQGRTGKD